MTSTGKKRCFGAVSSDDGTALENKKLAREESHIYSYESLHKALEINHPNEKKLRSKLIFLTSDQSSWIIHIRHWYYDVYQTQKNQLSYVEWFNKCWKLHPNHQDSIVLFGKKVLMPRYQQVYGENSYKFSNTKFDAKEIPSHLQDPIKRMQDLVVSNSDKETTMLNSCLVNWYANGDHYMGPHADDEAEIIPLSPIMSLSLGASRKFRFLPKKNQDKNHSKTWEINLEDGDLLIMGGKCQSHINMPSRR
jgi:alkylated DNA repair dioxygenase AlkB